MDGCVAGPTSDFIASVTCASVFGRDMALMPRCKGHKDYILNQIGVLRCFG